MKILSGFLSLCGFIGILAAGLVLPKTDQSPPEKTPSTQAASSQETEIEADLSILENLNQALESGDWEQVAIELENPEVKSAIRPEETATILQQSLQAGRNTRESLAATTKQLERLTKKFEDSVTDAQALAENQNESDEALLKGFSSINQTLKDVSERLKELENRPVPALPEPAAEPIETPDSEDEPEPAPAPLPTPNAVSLQFEIGSMNFTDETAEKIKKAAAKMKADPSVEARIQGNATGYSASLGTGRAESVQSKFVEFGISANRITVSSDSSKASDSVSVTFRKTKKRATTDS